MQLYFLRHGEAGAQEHWKGKDAERPLSKEGASRMEKEAEAIARLQLTLDAILTSPLLRALQTAQIVAKKMRLEEAIVVEERLAPGFGAAELQRIIAEYRPMRGLLLVGHEPDFSQAISACIGGGRVECKKGSLIRVDIDESSPQMATLVWLLPPRVLAP
jgi:phosphohistidine phosphatase